MIYICLYYIDKIVQLYHPGKQIWELELWERKPIFDEYINTVKESRELIYKFYSALSAYDTPKGATIETIVKAATNLSNEKLELLIFDMLGRSSEKTDFALDFFTTLSPKNKENWTKVFGEYPNPKDIDKLIQMNDTTERGMEAILDVVFNNLTPANAVKKWKSLDQQIELPLLKEAIKQVKSNPELLELIKVRRGKSIFLDEQSGMRPED